jgi:hypothetical protein
MKKMFNFSKLFATASLSLVAASPILAQSNLGASCGCPAVSSRPDVIVSSMAGYVAVSGTYGGELTNGAAFTCQNNYILDKKIYIPSGKTLTIQPGTVIKGANNPVAAEKTALIIERGGKIIANGTESCPIVFTAQADPMDGTYLIKNNGMWGGVVLLGKATNNLKPSLNGPFTAGSGNGKLCVANAEGLGVVEGFATSNPQDQFGVDITAGGSFDDNDNSGIMRYVSIRHGGAILSVGSEINGLTLASVGRGTTIENIEIVSCGDDNIEIFGGTVNLKYCTTIFGNDDMFDFDLGWTGKAQFLFGMKTPWSASTVAPVFGTITLTSGAITNIAVTNGGSGFSSTTPPTVTIAGGVGSGATATATVNSSGVITGLTITNGGTGYTVTTGITVTVGLDNLSPDNDNGIEGDADDQSSNYLPKSHPVIYNVTIMGNGKSTGSADNRGLAAVNLKDGAEGEIYNSVFANFKNGLNLQTTFGGTRTEGDSWQNWSTSAGPVSATAGNGTEKLKFKCNTFVGVSNKVLTKNASVLNGTTTTPNTPADYLQFLTTDKNDSLASIPGFSYAFVLSSPNTSNAVTTKNDVTPTTALSVVGCPTVPVDGFFTPANYRGAFSSVAGENWLSDWSYSQVMGATLGVVACPTDLNLDGITDVNDFLIFAPAFGTSCN